MAADAPVRFSSITIFVSLELPMPCQVESPKGGWRFMNFAFGRDLAASYPRYSTVSRHSDRHRVNKKENSGGPQGRTGPDQNEDYNQPPLLRRGGASDNAITFYRDGTSAEHLSGDYDV